MDLVTKTKRWANFLGTIREFFDSKGLYEVSTANLVPVGAFENSLDPLEVSYSEKKTQLHTSPEFEMKWLLSQTHLPIYQICKCFRDDPPTDIHFIEFTMLEYYRPYCDYRTTCQDMRELFGAVSGKALSFETYTMNEIVAQATGIDLDKCKDAPSLREAITERSLVALDLKDTWEDMFFKLMIERVEPSLNPNVPTIITDYPEPLNVLGKVNPQTGYTERFEIYWNGMELCNGCTELANVDELKRRYQRESEARIARGKLPHPFPERLYQALLQNFPEASGVAVGLERLFRCLD